jgi:hypothetical protein
VADTSNIILRLIDRSLEKFSPQRKNIRIPSSGSVFAVGCVVLVRVKTLSHCECWTDEKCLGVHNGLLLSARWDAAVGASRDGHRSLYRFVVTSVSCNWPCADGGRMAHQDVSLISGAFSQFEQSWVFSHDDSVSCIVMRMHPAERRLKWQKRPRMSGGPNHGHLVAFLSVTGMERRLASVNAGPESRRECSAKPLGFENLGGGTWAVCPDIARIWVRRKFRSGRPLALAEAIRASGHGRVEALPRARSYGFAKRSSRRRGTLPYRSLALAWSPRGVEQCGTR